MDQNLEQQIKVLAQSIARLSEVRDHFAQLSRERMKNLVSIKKIELDIRRIEEEGEDKDTDMLAEEYLQCFRNLKLLDFEIKLVKRKLTELEEKDKEFEELIFLSEKIRPGYKLEDTFPSLNLIKKNQHIIKEIDDAIHVGTKCFEKLGALKQFMAAGVSFEQSGHTYHENQVLKSMVSKHLEEAKNYIETIEHEFEILITELTEAKLAMRSLNDQDALKILGFNYKQLHDLLESLKLSQVISQVKSNADQLMDEISYLLKIMNRRKSGLKKDLIYLKEKLIENQINPNSLQDESEL